MNDMEFIDECRMRGMNDNRQREALDRLEALVKANEVCRKVYEKARDRNYDEMPNGANTTRECQYGDANHVMRQVEDELAVVFAAADAAKKEGGK